VTPTGIRRVVPDLRTDRMAESRAFYVDVIGLEVGMDLGWIVTLGSTSNPTAQLSLMEEDATAPVVPNVTVEVADVDAVHAAAAAAGARIVHPLTDEPWGVRRFFVADPNGVVVNVMQHLAPAAAEA
jgi:catechol 2,3-dioxygenase-like lactoylglutathione lyase family enzyme